MAINNLANCPTWIGDLLLMLDSLIEGGHKGAFHCIGTEPKSRYQYATAVAKAFGLDASLIKPFDLDFSVDIRPPMVRLSGEWTYHKLGVFPKDLEENLLFCASYLTNNS